ncbi:MAG: CDP-alcohol phosphatidyltransferase family protein [Deltaproteobacteria bacterium]
MPSGLLELYRATLKPKDLAFNVYVCRPLAALFVYALKGTRVAPNQVTFFSLLVAIGAAACLLCVTWPLGLWLGVAVYELSYVFDKVDGMLARARGVQSSTGHLLDFLMDEIKAFLILAAAAAGAYRSTGDVHALFWGLGGVVCLASGIGITTFQRRPEVLEAARASAAVASQGASPASMSSPMSSPISVPMPVRLAESVGRFFIHYPSYIWLAAAFSDVRLYLYPYVVVNALYAARSMLGLMLRYGGLAPVSSATSSSAGVDPAGTP